MKILVIGGGAREHAIVWKLSRERDVTEVVCAPGNPGIAALARCVPVDLERPSDIFALASREAVDLTVVGPELPLSVGVADFFATRRGALVGPTRAAAQLESSKSFAKDFMARHRVPTARFRVCHSPTEALAAISSGEFGYPLVLKADGLAAGKGVVIAEDQHEAEEAVRAAMVDRRFGSAGDRIVFEEFLVGEEASYFVLADGTACVPLSSAQDHKRIFDDDRGPNTGGMGAFAPSPLMDAAMERRVLDEIVMPVLHGMESEGTPFRGFLYVGLMLTADGPKVIEFNVRFGDPEAQVVLPMLDEDLSWLLAAAATGALPSRSARFKDEPHVGVVLASGGYPDSSESGKIITGVDAASKVPGALVFHAGTSRRDGQLVTAGGRVLTVVGRGATHRAAIDVAYAAASRIAFDGMQSRRDIGQSAPMKYAIVTFGCRVNQADSLVIEDRLRSSGATEAPADQADLLVVNTCSVTASADQGARQTIRRIVRNNPDVQVVVTGCYATRQPDDVAALPNVTLVVPNSAKDDFDFTTARRFGDGDGPCGGALAPGVAGRTALTLRVQTGCEERCSYCIIPQTRGASRSRPLRDIVEDVRRAVAAGYKEIAIAGVHLGSYGRDLPDRSSFAALVAILGDWDADVLFRISSLEPMDCTADIVDMVAASPRLAPHFHLPLQHGADGMLEAMRRPYSVAYYIELVTRIRATLPAASIGSDIIVGFPGESDAHFAEMCAVLGRLPLTHLHVFPYSDRPGTAAAALRAKVDGLAIRERARVIRGMAGLMAAGFRASQAGRTRRALVVDDGLSAVTDNYLKVRLTQQHTRNEWVDAVIDG